MFHTSWNTDLSVLIGCTIEVCTTYTNVQHIITKAGPMNEARDGIASSSVSGDTEEVMTGLSVYQFRYRCGSIYIPLTRDHELSDPVWE